MSRSSTFFLSGRAEQREVGVSSQADTVKEQRTQHRHHLGGKFLISADAHERSDAAVVPHQIHPELFRSEIHTGVCCFQNKAD